jgi:UDP-N-acetylmuramoyl-L-alanyl-D-glutamate--2,6-diaminopimelate ligase
MSIKTIIKKLLPKSLINLYHLGLAFLSALIYGFPSRKIKVIGITGTNGKSTTLNIASKILEANGFKVAALTSIMFKIGEKEEENKLKMTMPGRFVINKFLRDAVKAKCE